MIGEDRDPLVTIKHIKTMIEIELGGVVEVFKKEEETIPSVFLLHWTGRRFIENEGVIVHVDGRVTVADIQNICDPLFLAGAFILKANAELKKGGYERRI